MEPCRSETRVWRSFRAHKPYPVTVTLLIICIQLHFGQAACSGEISLNQVDSISSGRSCHWLTSCNLPYACFCEARPGCYLTTLFGSTAVMPIDGSKEETNPCAVAHRGVPAFLRSDDHADRRTRFGHSIATQSHQDPDERQRRTVEHEGKGHRRSANGPDKSSGPCASSFGADSVYPDSVDPGSSTQATAAPCPRTYRQDGEAPASASSRARCGFGQINVALCERFSAQVAVSVPSVLEDLAPMKVLTLALMFSLTAANPTPPVRRPSGHLEQHSKGGRWYFAANGHAVYCYGPVMTLPRQMGTCKKSPPSAATAKLSCL